MSLQDTNDILDEIYYERKRQGAKWGEQNHPDYSDDLYGRAVLLADADTAKYLCDDGFKYGHGSYAHILLEEFQEALAEAQVNDKEKLYVELIQTAAVAVAWAEKLRREGVKGNQ